MDDERPLEAALRGLARLKAVRAAADREALRRILASELGAASRGMPLKTVTFGRDKTRADVHINDEYASPLHCQATQYEDGTVLVEDLGSTNGTWIGAMKVVGEMPIYPGDVLRVGRTELPWKA